MHHRAYTARRAHDGPTRFARVTASLASHVNAHRHSPGGLERGQALVEFALVAMLFMGLIVLLVQFGVAFNYKNQLTEMTGVGTRWAAVDKNPCVPPPDTPLPFCERAWNAAQVRDPDNPAAEPTLQDSILATGVGPELLSDGRVCVFPGEPTEDDPHPPVNVKASFDYHWLPILAQFGIEEGTVSPIVGSTTMRTEKAPSTYSADDNPDGCTPA